MYSKYSIFIIFLTLTLKVVGQQLPRGTFVLSTGYTYTEFNFKANSKFKYKYSSCDGGQKGSGVYTFKDKDLVLIFDNPRKKYLPQSHKIDRRNSQNDTSFIYFMFFGPYNNEAVPGVILKFKSKVNGITYGTQSNEKGQAKLKITKVEFPLEIEINYLGTEPKILKLDTAGDYSIKFPLSYEFIKFLIKGDSLHFIVDNFSEDKIELKPMDEKEFRILKRKDD